MIGHWLIEIVRNMVCVRYMVNSPYNNVIYFLTIWIKSKSWQSSNSTTVKHVDSDHAYNKMTLIRKHLEIPGKHS